MPESSTAETVSLWDWLDLLTLATGRRWLNQREAAVALFVGRSGTSTSGEDCTIDAARMAIEFDVTERTIWRCVEVLVDGGWITQSQAARRGQKGKPGTGRKARYRLTYPSVTVSHHADDMACQEGA